MAMELKQHLMKQFRKPAGNLGKVVGWVMSANNIDRALWTVRKLRFKPSDHLLEVGYGPGSTVKLIAERLTSGTILGIDHSATMLKMAAKKNRSFINQKKVALKQGVVQDMEDSDMDFDIIYGSNVHFFWKNPVEEFRILYQHLKPGGRLAMVFQPRWAKSETQVREIAETTRQQYLDVGFGNIELDFKSMKPVTCISVIGEKQHADGMQFK